MNDLEVITWDSTLETCIDELFSFIPNIVVGSCVKTVNVQFNAETSSNLCLLFNYDSETKLVMCFARLSKHSSANEMYLVSFYFSNLMTGFIEFLYSSIPI